MLERLLPLPELVSSGMSLVSAEQIVHLSESKNIRPHGGQQWLIEK